MKHTEEWTLDIRVGCVAVYEGPKRNCLYDGDFIFFAKGEQMEDGTWRLRDEDVQLQRARLLAKAPFIPRMEALLRQLRTGEVGGEWLDDLDALLAELEEHE